ncbi:MAG TPA: helix-turn-helix transcriptional regulator [Mucilaginibacter sp.]|jgi:AraC-like DNA-binding protein|nr:helix-turn-helix transcriptional regulator [Mucilaginibacter sp.]
MYAINTETIIPQYPLEPDEFVGDKHFRIRKANCSMSRERSDFLVPHRKDYYFLVFVKEGSSRHWIDMKPYTIRNDTFYFTIPHQVHLKEDVQPFTGTSIGFTSEFLNIMGNASLKQLPIIQNPHNGHELNLKAEDVLFIEDMLDKIYNEFNSKKGWQHNMLMSYMQVLLIFLSRLYTVQFSDTAQSQDRQLLKRYLSRIEEMYTELHEVNNYADILNISAGHLSEVVKEQSGKPAIVHIHERLIMEAKRLLFHSERSIKEIAFELGFEDASYFNRFFKRITQTTPAVYRSSTREMYH